MVVEMATPAVEVNLQFRKISTTVVVTNYT